MAEQSQQGGFAWGKVILLGEHAVVYGHKAIAGAIERGVHCSASPSSSARLLVTAWDIDVQVGDEHPVANALRAILEASEAAPALLEAQSDLPAGAGLGSSAALCVAIARALRPDLQGPGLEALANRGEVFFHENPSGIDVALSSGGGMGVYRKATGLTPIDCPKLPLVVGLSGVPRSTAAMVAGVGQRLRDKPALETHLQAIANQVELGQEALLAGELEPLGALMDQNHASLRELGVSIDALDQMVEAAREAGALGAKLTGAGGGGAMIALAPGRQDEVSEKLQSLGYESFVTNLGAPRTT